MCFEILNVSFMCGYFCKSLTYFPLYIHTYIGEIFWIKYTRLAKIFRMRNFSNANIQTHEYTKVNHTLCHSRHKSNKTAQANQSIPGT